MKKIILLLSIVFLAMSCSDDQQKLDTRLDGLDITFSHIDPSTSLPVKNKFKETYTEDKNEDVNILIDVKNKSVKKVEVISSENYEVIKTFEMNKVNFVMPFNELGVKLGQSGKLIFNVYFDDTNGDFDYPSMRMYTFDMISYLEPIAYYKKADGTLEPLVTKDHNVEKFYVDPAKGVTVEFKPNVASYLEIAKSDFLDLGTDKNLCFSFWINPLDMSYGGDPLLISTGDWDSAGNQGYNLAMKGGGKLRYALADGLNKVDLNGTNVSNITTGWQFITVVADRKKNATLYINGVEQQSAPMTSIMNSDFAGTRTVKINQDGTGKYESYLQAEYRQIMFYETALTALEIQAIYNATK